MANQTSITELLQLIHTRDTFLISSHARPDGDAIGSSVALMHLLESMGKQVTVAFADPIPAQFFCLQGVDRIVHSLPAERPDAAIVLECDSVQRTGFEEIQAAFTINIDHHLSGRDYADFNWIDPQACAVGAMLYDLTLASGQPITPALADCLYTAVLTDTGSFNFPSTTAATFALAEHLVQCGTSPNRIAQAMFFSNPPSKVRLLGAALSHMHVRGPLCWSVITTRDMERAEASNEDCEGVVNHLIAMAGIEAAALLRQQPNGTEFRVSLRSKGTSDLDVARVAEHFGGGGHRNASGCTLHGTIHEATQAVLAQLELHLHTPGLNTALRPPLDTVEPHAAPSTLLA